MAARLEWEHALEDVAVKQTRYADATCACTITTLDSEAECEGHGLCTGTSRALTNYCVIIAATHAIRALRSQSFKGSPCPHSCSRRPSCPRTNPSASSRSHLHSCTSTEWSAAALAAPSVGSPCPASCSRKPSCHRTSPSANLRSPLRNHTGTGWSRGPAGGVGEPAAWSGNRCGGEHSTRPSYRHPRSWGNPRRSSAPAAEWAPEPVQELVLDSPHRSACSTMPFCPRTRAPCSCSSTARRSS